MLTRRVLLSTVAVTSLAAPVLAAPALAAEARRRPAHPAGHAARTAKTAPAMPAEPTTPAETPIGPVDTAARWAVITDFNTGATILEKDADTRMTPSSLTKIMTAYIVFGKLKAGQLKLDQTLLVSEKAWRMGGSKMFVRIGTQVSVEDLIRGMIIQSGNDACIVLAEGIAGSEDQFVDLMNQKAKELGLTNSHFMNCTGWPADGHYMSVRDIATLTTDLIRNFPEYYKYADERSFTYNNITQGNRNTLVDKGLADGIKTGHTEEGGYGLCASADRNGRRVVLVLNGMISSRQRSEEGERMLEWAFREFEDVTLFSAGDTVESVPVWLGTQPTVPLVGGRNLVVTMPRNWRSKAKVSVSFESPIRAPVLRGSKLGQLAVTGDGVPNLTIPLLAGADVPRLSLPGRAIAVLTHYVTGG